MIDLHATFFHHLLELAVADRIRHIPAHAPEYDLPLKMTSLEFNHRGGFPEPNHARAYVRHGEAHSLATEPGCVPLRLISTMVLLVLAPTIMFKVRRGARARARDGLAPVLLFRHLLRPLDCLPVER